MNIEEELLELIESNLNKSELARAIGEEIKSYALSITVTDFLSKESEWPRAFLLRSGLVRRIGTFKVGGLANYSLTSRGRELYQELVDEGFYELKERKSPQETL